MMCADDFFQRIFEVGLARMGMLYIIYKVYLPIRRDETRDRRGWLAASLAVFL